MGFRLSPALAISLLLLVLGCRPRTTGETNGDSLPFAGVTVRLAVPSDLGLTETWTAALEDWAAASGASYEIVETPFESGDWQDNLIKSSPTLLLLPHRLVPELVADNLIAPIPPEIRTSEQLQWSGLLPGVRDRLTSVAGEPAILPVTCETLVCYFRADLLEASGRSIPQTWDDYDALRSSLDDWAPGLTVVEPWGPEFRSTMFFARAIAGARHPAQYSLSLDVSTGDPLIAGPPFVRALQDSGSSGQLLNMADMVRDIADCRRELLEGRAAMGIACEPTDTGANRPSATTRDPGVRLICSPLPGADRVFNRDTGQWDAQPGGALNRPAVCGFEGLTVCVLKSASAEQIAAAWDLWGVLQNFQQEGTIPQLPGTSVNHSMLANATQPAGSELTLAEWSSYRQAVTANLSNPLLTFELPCAGRDQLRNEMSHELQTGTAEGRTPETVLQSTSDAWRTTIHTLGKRRVINSYRACLGLRPLP